MKKQIFLILLGSLILWADGWSVNKNTFDNITYGYGEDKSSLRRVLSEVQKEFYIRIFLLKENHTIQDGLKKYYEEKMPKELKNAINGSNHFHSPSIKPLRKVFPSAFKSTVFYKNLAKELFKKGYALDLELNFEKFHIAKHKNSYVFSADIWKIKAIPLSTIWLDFLVAVESNESKEDFPLFFNANFMKKLRENETFYRKIEVHTHLDFEVIVTTTQANEIAPGHEGGQHAFYFKDTLKGYTFSGIDTIP